MSTRVSSRRLLVGLAALLAAAVAPVGSASSSGSRAVAPTVRELVGQRLVVAFRGTTPSAALLERVRRGEIGGVILFGGNVTGRAQLRSLTNRLQATARAAGRPPLLVTTDQEGGTVRRLPWAGPTLAATDLGREDPLSIRAQARAAALSLAAAGVNVDLAPVADVPSAGSFMAAAQRTFGTSPSSVSAATTAFAAGLADGKVAATVKHFPGIGAATRNTDRSAVVVGGGRTALDASLAPFRAAIAAGVPIVMVSNASYSALDAKPAAWSPGVQTLLRRELGFQGVTISDALDGAAATRGRTLPSVAVLSAQAGVDLLLLIGSEASSASVYEHLVEAAEAGRIPATSLQRSYDRILELKRAYAAPPGR
jgi:beta-N-acetylhexosaminidase